MIDATRRPIDLGAHLSVSGSNDDLANGMSLRKMRVGGVELIHGEDAVGDSLDYAFA
ncbi:hypothetical protein [Roseovarius arcticus]|uniref:hypothetical protein n=1 Tax=Roseovarius arcticus TaxID=2547404 RepID=UPI001485CCB2|nr:hypothetical protein [Roseovarius arcticus]